MTPTRPSADYWSDGVAPALHPGMNTRETAIMDYAEAVVAEAILDTSKTASWTLALADKGKTFLVNSTSAIVVTIPTNASVAFPVGSIVQVVRWNTGTVTITPDSGVTRHAAGGFVALRAQYSGCVLVKVATNEWWLQGDLA